MRGEVAVVLATCAACSMYMDEVPKGWDPSQGAPECTSSEAAPSADFALAAPLLIAAVTYVGIGFAAGDERCGDNDIGSQRACTIGVVSLLAAVPHTWSGLHGASAARRCREAKQAARAWDERHPVMTMQQRREKARRKTVEERRIRRWGSLRCARLVADWRIERHRVHKRMLFDRMPDDCRDRVHPPRR